MVNRLGLDVLLSGQHRDPPDVLDAFLQQNFGAATAHLNLAIVRVLLDEGAVLLFGEHGRNIATKMIGGTSSRSLKVRTISKPALPGMWISVTIRSNSPSPISASASVADVADRHENPARSNTVTSTPFEIGSSSEIRTWPAVGSVSESMDADADIGAGHWEHAGTLQALFEESRNLVDQYSGARIFP